MGRRECAKYDALPAEYLTHGDVPTAQRTFGAAVRTRLKFTVRADSVRRHASGLASSLRATGLLDHVCHERPERNSVVPRARRGLVLRAPLLPLASLGKTLGRPGRPPPTQGEIAAPTQRDARGHAARLDPRGGGRGAVSPRVAGRGLYRRKPRPGLRAPTRSRTAASAATAQHAVTGRTGERSGTPTSPRIRGARTAPLRAGWCELRSSAIAFPIAATTDCASIPPTSRACVARTNSERPRVRGLAMSPIVGDPVAGDPNAGRGARLFSTRHPTRLDPARRRGFGSGALPLDEPQPCARCRSSALAVYRVLATGRVGAGCYAACGRGPRCEFLRRSSRSRCLPPVDAPARGPRAAVHEVTPVPSGGS